MLAGPPYETRFSGFSVLTLMCVTDTGGVAETLNRNAYVRVGAVALAVFALLLLIGAARGHSEITPSSAPAIATPTPDQASPDSTNPYGSPRRYGRGGGGYGGPRRRGFGGGGGGGFRGVPPSGSAPTTPPDDGGGTPNQTTSDGSWT